MDPNILINLMVELAGLEEELLQVRSTLTVHARSHENLAELQDEVDQDAEDAAAAERSAEVEFRAREREIQALEADLLDRKKQMSNIRDERELKAMQHQLASIEARIEELESRALEQLEKVDQLEEAAEEARRDRDRREAKRSLEISEHEVVDAQATAAEPEIVGEIERLMGMLPERERRHILRLKKQFPQTVVRVEGTCCGGCFMQLPAQLAGDAERGTALVRCPSCVRYVVRRSWS